MLNNMMITIRFLSRVVDFCSHVHSISLLETDITSIHLNCRRNYITTKFLGGSFDTFFFFFLLRLFWFSIVYTLRACISIP